MRPVKGLNPAVRKRAMSGLPISCSPSVANQLRQFDGALRRKHLLRIGVIEEFLEWRDGTRDDRSGWYKNSSSTPAWNPRHVPLKSEAFNESHQLCLSWSSAYDNEP